MPLFCDACSRPGGLHCPGSIFRSVVEQCTDGWHVGLLRSRSLWNKNSHDETTRAFSWRNGFTAISCLHPDEVTMCYSRETLVRQLHGQTIWRGLWNPDMCSDNRQQTTDPTPGVNAFASRVPFELCCTLGKCWSTVSRLHIWTTAAATATHLFREISTRVMCTSTGRTFLRN